MVRSVELYLLFGLYRTACREKAATGVRAGAALSLLWKWRKLAEVLALVSRIHTSNELDVSFDLRSVVLWITLKRPIYFCI